MRNRSSLSLVLVLALVLVAVLPVHADTGAAASWLESQQRADGGFGLEQSTLSDTAEAVFALTAAGVALDDVAVEGVTPVDYLTANLDSAATVGAQAKAALALSAAGLDVTDVEGTDLVAAITGAMNDEGRFGDDDATFTDSLYAVLALAAAGQEVPVAANDWIAAHQGENGAWAWNGSTEAADTDSNTTGLALQSLLAAGVAADNGAVVAGLDYLRSIQNEDGGFPYQKPSEWGTDTDANSTAMALMAITAAGQDPAAWATEEGATPTDALNALQNDSGAFSWQAAMPDDNLFATCQAIPALLGRPYPIAPLTGVVAAEEPAAAATAESTAEPTAAVTAEATAAPAATATPATVMPTTGGVISVTPWGQILMLAGAGLATGGYLVRRHLSRISGR